jgi:hypothetical protein
LASRKTIKRVQGDFKLEQLQRNIEDFLKASVPEFLANGEDLGQLVLASGANVVNHKLQRVPQGFLILDQNANASVYRTAATDRTVTLTASAAVTVKVWVY